MDEGWGGVCVGGEGAGGVGGMRSDGIGKSERTATGK